jgi:AraC-like DNA-binding protein
MASADAFAKTYCRFYESPLEVRFVHPAPAYRSSYSKVFQSPVRFGAPDNAFVMTRAQLETPLKSSHSGLRGEYEQHAAALLAAIRGSAGTTVAVRRVLLAELQTGACKMTSVARKLAMSVPTLRRRLEEESVTYEAILDEVRYDLAKRYLSDPRIATSDVAFLVGFRHASSFSKAFRRWTGGTTSTEFRARATEGAEGGNEGQTRPR